MTYFRFPSDLLITMSLRYASLVAIFSVAIAKPVSIGNGEDEGFHGDSIVKVCYSNTYSTHIRLFIETPSFQRQSSRSYVYTHPSTSPLRPSVHSIYCVPQDIV